MAGEKVSLAPPVLAGERGRWMGSTHFILEGHEPVACDLMTWAQWYNTADDARRVARTEGDGWEVSTVFLGLNHNYHGGPPELFETMIFGEKFDNECWRCATWDEAEVIHNRIVEDLRAGREPGKDL